MARKRVRSLRPMVRVRWKDAHSDRSGGWVLPGNRDKDPWVNTSVGFLVDPKPGHISICLNMTEDEQEDSHLHVLEQMVIDVEYLVPATEIKMVIDSKKGPSPELLYDLISRYSQHINNKE